MTKQGQLRAYHIANGYLAHNVEVDTVEEAKKLIDKWTQEDLNNPTVEYNCFGLEEYDENFEENEGWSDWYNEDGESIIDVMDREAEEKED